MLMLIKFWKISCSLRDVQEIQRQQRMSFNDFVQKRNLKKKATSNVKIQQVLGSVGLHNVGIYLRDGPFEFDIGIVILHPYKGTLGVLYINESYFDSMLVLLLENYLNIL